MVPDRVGSISSTPQWLAYTRQLGRSCTTGGDVADGSAVRKSWISDRAICPVTCVTRFEVESYQKTRSLEQKCDVD